MEKEVKLQKIPLVAFIDALVNLYNNGANFVDIIGLPNVDQDIIGLAVKQEYIDLEDEDEEERETYNENYTIEKKVILTEDDIDRLTEN